MLYDLLSPTPGNVDSLQIVDEAGATAVKGLTHLQVATEEEALALLFEGNKLPADVYICYSAQADVLQSGDTSRAS